VLTLVGFLDLKSARQRLGKSDPTPTTAGSLAGSISGTRHHFHDARFAKSTESNFRIRAQTHRTKQRRVSYIKRRSSNDRRCTKSQLGERCCLFRDHQKADLFVHKPIGSAKR
jgi:hypothetical protein